MDARDAAAELLRLDRQLEDAMLRGDLATLERLYADDFVFVHGDGHADTKSTWLAGVGRSPGLWLGRDTDAVEARVHAATAIVTGTSTIRRIPNDRGLPQLSRYHYMRVWVRTESGTWQLVAQHSSRLPAPAI